MSIFDFEKFKNPAKEHNVIYTWVWNSDVTKQKIDSRLEAYYNAGIMGLYVLPLPKNFRPGYMETFLEPEYLSEEFFALLKYAFCKAKDYGMELWLYDEGGWPSGGACGLTGAQNDQAYETTLVKKEITIKKGESYVLNSPVIAVFEGTQRLENSFVAQRDMSVCEYLAQKSTEKHPNRIDTTNKLVVDTFINNTYNAYFSHFSDLFGTDLKAFFTDEPSLLKNTLPQNFFASFEQKYGYDVINYLPFLLDGSLEMNQKQSQARIDYAHFLGELFYENYCKNIADWCGRHKIKMAGHLDIDHTAHSTDNHAYFSHLHCLSAFDIPGIDVIWEQIAYPYNDRPAVKEGYAFFPKIASSAAHQKGTGLALSESFAVYGDGLTPDEMRYVLNYQAIRGINIFNFMLTSIDSENLNAMVERPVFSPEKPGFYNLKHINQYYARLCYLLKLGKPIIDTALYIPCADFWAGDTHRDKTAKLFDELGVELEKKHIPFDIVDDYAVADAFACEQGLKIGDAVYNSVMVSECKFMPNATSQKIAPFRNQKSKPLIKGLDKNLRVMARKFENGKLYFIFNQGLKTVSQTVDIRGENIYEVDVLCGELHKITDCEISLSCGDMAVFLVSDSKLEAVTTKTEFSQKVENFVAKGYKQFKLTSNGLCKKECCENAVDFDFSGEICFESSFTLPKTPTACQRYKIRLENTSVTASVKINGVLVATLGLKPMQAVIGGEYLKKENTIEITVSNTAANEIIANHSVIEGFPKAHIGSYDCRCINFEKRRYNIALGEVFVEKML